MDLDTLLTRYFGAAELEHVDPSTLVRGREALTIDLGIEQEPGRKFALWTLLEATGGAPLPADAFPDHPDLKRAAEDYLSATERMLPDD